MFYIGEPAPDPEDCLVLCSEIRVSPRYSLLDECVQEPGKGGKPPALRAVLTLGLSAALRDSSAS